MLGPGLHRGKISHCFNSNDFSAHDFGVKLKWYEWHARRPQFCLSLALWLWARLFPLCKMGVLGMLGASSNTLGSFAELGRRSWVWSWSEHGGAEREAKRTQGSARVIVSRWDGRWQSWMGLRSCEAWSVSLPVRRVIAEGERRSLHHPSLSRSSRIAELNNSFYRWGN